MATSLEGSSSNDAGPVATKKELRLGRPYQVDLVEYALYENTIVSLGTGAGKTFVAVMLIRELSHLAKGHFTDEEGQRIVFLAHTVPLVKQQAEYIRENTDLKVSEFVGDAKGIDNWPKDTWYRHFNANNVLVFSRAIFVDLLNKAFIKPRQLALLIFDECHHATKNDPFVQVMRVIKDAPEIERPRILGLSASLLGQKVKPGELKKGVKGLESILMSRARTAPDLTEVVKFATNPEEKINNYSSQLDEAGSRLKEILSGPLTFLQSKVDKRKGKFPIEESAKNLLDDLHHILVDLGPASASDFVRQTLNELCKTMQQNEASDKWEELIGCLVLSKLMTFDKECRMLKEKYGGRLQDSKKVRSMLLELADAALRSGEGEGGDKTLSSATSKEQSVKSSYELRGIIFTERRHTASCLCKLLQEKSTTDPELKHIKCDYVVGHNIGQNTTAMRKEAHMNAKKQDRVLGKFRKGHINLLIATSVIEEGVDVPRCNLVVRFDLPQNFRAYIQSKGRARDKPSTFLLLVSDEQSKYLEDISNYHMLEKELIELCQSDRALPSEEEIQAKMADLVPPYMPNGRDGARVTVGNSLTLLHRYCEHLPHDIYTKMSPIFNVTKIPKTKGHTQQEDSLPCLEEEEEDPKYNYICELSLPTNCPVKEAIYSPPLGSKLQSKRAAALFAVESLHKREEVNDIFKASSYPDSDDEELTEERSRQPLAGSDKRHATYETEVHSALTTISSKSAGGYHLYMFVIKFKSTGKLYNTQQGVGVLTTEILYHWMIPSYSLYVKDHPTEGEVELTVTLQLVQSPLPSLTDEELNIYRECHHAIFTTLLSVAPPEIFKPDFINSKKNYIIVPVTINSIDGLKIETASIDFDTAGDITCKVTKKVSPKKPYSSEDLNQSLVIPAHRPMMTSLELFSVQVDPSITPLSPFSIAKYRSYSEFFQNKYNFPLNDEDQPGLVCTRVNTSYFKLFVSRFCQGEEPSTDKNTSIVMFPELVHLFPVSVHFWRVLRCLPALLWRLESLLLADEFARQVRNDTLIGFLTVDSALLTSIPVIGYTDLGHGTLPSIVVSEVNPEIRCHGNGSHANSSHDDLSKRGPNSGLVLQALTPKAANDSINLERLELLADSLLKLVTSVYLFNARPSDHEGKLSTARSRRVSNLNLFYLGQKKGITTKIMATDFNMDKSGCGRVQWIPPGYVLMSPKTSEHYLCPSISDKGVADSVEALIGAHTVAGGLEGGISFMKWLGIKLGEINNEKLTAYKEGSSQISQESSNSFGSIPLLYSNSSQIFTKYFGAPPTFSRSDALQDKQHLFLKVSSVQLKIKYQFKNECLLIEAMTHASYNWNRLTDCYQRLEFLGDAILDYLVTCHVYQSDSSAEPGKITELRSALVCNTNFSELAVSLNLHKCLLHSSPDLFRDLRKYANAVNESNKESSYNDGLSLLYKDTSFSSKNEQTTIESSIEMDYIIEEEEEEEGMDPPKPLSDCFEALAGAVFVDSNMSLQQVWSVFFPLLQPQLEKFKSNPQSSNISLLHKMVPTGLKVTKQIVRPRSACRVPCKYRCIITIENSDICGMGVANYYKNAKNEAAAQVLKELSKNNETM